MWPTTWRVAKGMLMGLLLLGEMCVRVVVLLVCAVVLAMTFLAHFVGGPRG